MEDRLQNILARAGVASRRASAEIIESGAVTVDGLVVREPGARFGEGAVVRVHGRRIASAEKKRTIVLYKPVGVLSTMSDPFGGATVAELVKTPERLVPIGRLDKDSEGLLLMSNDGNLVNELTHPRFEHKKIYHVKVAGRWSEEKLKTLRSPLTLDDGYTIRPVPVREIERRSGADRPTEVTAAPRDSYEDSKRTTASSVGGDHRAPRYVEPNVRWLEFTLSEGRKRQIRKMCSLAHLVVLELKRVQVGAFALPPELKPGEWRDLTPTEIESLRK